VIFVATRVPFVAMRLLVFALIFFSVSCETARATPAFRKSYLVMLGDDETSMSMDELCDNLEGLKTTRTCLWRLRIKCKRRLQLSNGFSALLKEEEVKMLRHCVPNLHIEPDVEVTAANYWGLDRVNQRGLPLDSKFLSPDELDAALVHVYVLDTGIRKTHYEFRNIIVTAGVDMLADENDAPVIDDCDGHGTFVSSTVSSMTHRVAIHPVRVLDCHGNGELSALVAGLEWVAAHHQFGPAIVSLALGIRQGVWSQTLEKLVRRLIREREIFVVTASGNQQTDACNVAPGNVRETLTVAASDHRDHAYEYGNSGACVDLYAPGVNVLGACGGFTSCDSPSDFSYTFLSGTSMAVGHAVGAAARVLSRSPKMSATALKQHLIITATKDLIRGIPLPGTPNALLYLPPVNKQHQ